MVPTMIGALLVLADGTAFEGEAIGAPVPISSGEVVFNTVLAGYQEVITDPSYAGQIVTFTCPHIGNYGVTGRDDEGAHLGEDLHRVVAIRIVQLGKFRPRFEGE